MQSILSVWIIWENNMQLEKVYHTYPLSLINKTSRGFSTSLGERKSGSGTDYFDSAEEIKSKAWQASRASHMENNSKFWIYCTQNITWLKFIWHLQKRCMWLIDVEIQCIFLYNYLSVAKLNIFIQSNLLLRPPSISGHSP